MGPLLLARMLGLSKAQEGVLNIAFKLSDEEGLPLLAFVGKHGPDLSLLYGHVSKSSVGAIQRQLLVLENQGGTKLFGEPALDLI